jgi:hypothetical protein
VARRAVEMLAMGSNGNGAVELLKSMSVQICDLVNPVASFTQVLEPQRDPPSRVLLADLNFFPVLGNKPRPGHRVQWPIRPAGVLALRLLLAGQSRLLAVRYFRFFVTRHAVIVPRFRGYPLTRRKLPRRSVGRPLIAASSGMLATISE